MGRIFPATPSLTGPMSTNRYPTLSSSDISLAKQPTKKPSFLSRILPEVQKFISGGPASYLTQKVGEKAAVPLAKSIAQAVPRAITGAGLDVAGSFLNVQKPQYTPKGRIETAFLGTEPIIGLQQRQQEAQKATEERLKKMGLSSDAAKGIGIGASALAIAGLTAADLVPFTPESKLKLNPEVAKSVIDDVAKQVAGSVQGRGLLKPELAKAISNVDPNAIKSWGDLYTKMSEAVKHSPAALDVIGRHIDTRFKAFLDDPELMRQVIGGTEFVKQEAPKIAGAAIRTGEELGAKAFNAAEYVKTLAAKQKAAQLGEVPGFIAKTKNFISELKTKLVDFNAPIEDVLSKAQKGTKVTTINDYTNQVDKVLRAPTLAGQFVRDNGLDTIIRETDNINNLEQYLIARHSIDLANKGIETGRSLEKDKLLVQSLAPKYEEQAQVVNDYSRKLLDYASDAGLISKENAASLKQTYPNYVPMNRVFSEIEQANKFGQARGPASLSKQTVVQAIRGSEREVQSPFTSLLEKTSDAFNQGEKNKAAKMLASFKDLPGNPFDLKELPKGEGAAHTISYLDNGVKKTFETTPAVAAAAKSLNVQQLNILGQILAFPVRLAKVGITGINLPFIAANVAKDQVTGIINSKNALKTSVANPAVFLKSLFEAVKHGKIYDEMARSGALGTSFDIARNQATQTVEKIRAGRNIASKILYTVKHPSELLRAVENVVGRSEELTRIQQYLGTKQAALSQGLSETDAITQASRAARENTVNFARRGEWGQVLNSAFLYLNAGIQGTRTFLRNITQRPLQTATKLAAVVFTPVAAATAWNLSDPIRKQAYEDIAEYEKENNIILIPPNPTKNPDGTWNVIKIPLSQEINNLAGMVRRPIEQAYGLDAVSVDDISKALIGSVSPIAPTKGALASSLTPQALRPTIESYANKNFFTGYPQVSQSLSKLPTEQQVKPYTSGTVRKLAELGGLSPIKVEEWIKGTFGSVGSQILNVSDRALAGLDIIPKDQIGGQNVAKAILARFASARGGSLDNASNTKLEQIIMKQAGDNFRRRQEAEILYNKLSELPKEEANAQANELQKSNPLLYNKLKDVIEEQKLGLTYNDRLIKQLGVENGERARFIWENIQAFKTDSEKNDYVNEMRQKKIISDKVMEQLKKLKVGQEI